MDSLSGRSDRPNRSHCSEKASKEHIEVVLLAWRRLSIEVDALARCGALIVFPSKGTRVLNHAIALWLTSRTELTFKDTFIADIDTCAQEGILDQSQLELSLVIEILRATLPVKVELTAL